MYTHDSDTNNAQHHSKGIRNKKTQSIREYRMIERRALLQSIKADEKLIVQLSGLEADQDNTEVGILLFYLRRNAEERRKAFLQLVRDTEKEYDLKKR